MDLEFLSRYVHEGIEGREPLKETQVLSMVPIPNKVLIPGTVLPIRMGEPHYHSFVDQVVRSKEADVIVCFSPRGRDNQMMLSSICGVGRIVVIDELLNGRKEIVVEGNYRVEVIKVIQHRPLLKVEAKWIPDIPYRKPERMADMHRSFLKLIKQWFFLIGHVPMEYASMLDLFKYPHHLADFIAGYFLPDYTLKQKLLETPDCEMRVLIVEEILRKGVSWLSRNSPKIHEERPAGSWVN